MVARSPVVLHRLALCLGMLCGFVTCLYGIACILFADSYVSADKRYALAIHHYKMAQKTAQKTSDSQWHEKERLLLITRSLLLDSVRFKPDHTDSWLLLSSVLEDLEDDSNRQKALHFAQMLQASPDLKNEGNVKNGDYGDKIFSSLPVTDSAPLHQTALNHDTNYTFSMVEPLSFRFLEYGYLVQEDGYASIQ